MPATTYLIYTLEQCDVIFSEMLSYMQLPHRPLVLVEVFLYVDMVIQRKVDKMFFQMMMELTCSKLVNCNINAKTRDDDTNKILKEVHNMLHHLIKRVEGTEKELKSMKVRLSTPSSNSSSAI